jgi:hypothetical protein
LPILTAREYPTIGSHGVPEAKFSRVTFTPRDVHLERLILASSAVFIVILALAAVFDPSIRLLHVPQAFKRVFGV